MKPHDRRPRKGDQVTLHGIADRFEVIAVRSQSRVVDLQLVTKSGLVLNDVAWDRLLYPEETIP